MEQWSEWARGIFIQKYSMNGQETWADTCKRVVDAVCGQYLAAETQEKIYRLMLERKFIPGGRYLYSAGRPYHQVNNCFDRDTEIITSKGIRTLGDCIGADIKILNRYGAWESGTVKYFGKQPVYKMTFKNQLEPVLVTAGHKWWVGDQQYSTQELWDNDIRQIPLTRPESFPELDPEYIRWGIIYGDGTYGKNQRYTQINLIGENKQELAEWFVQEKKQVTVGGGAVREYDTIRDVATGKKISLQDSIYKSLPNASHLSPSQARGFIAGLFATDGSTKTSSCTISCEGEQVARKIAKIARLGGCVVTGLLRGSRVNPFNGTERDLWIIGLKPITVPVIRQDQKADLEKRNLRYACMWKEWESIELIDERDVFCVTDTASRSFTLANGLTTGNCYLFRAEDSREGWAEAMQKATSALMSGGGIGFDYSTVRPEGSKIYKTGGESTGPLALMHMINEAGRYIMQGGSRRSAIWAGLNWAHADISKFLQLKNWDESLVQLKAQNLNTHMPMEYTNISVIYDTEFFIAIEDKRHPKHKLAKQVWIQNCEQALKSAEPGMSFNFLKDNESLRNAPVSASTRVLTNTGYKSVGDIINKPVQIWTGKQWASTVFKKTKSNADLVRVSLSNGRQIICDPEHPFITKNYLGAGRKKKVDLVRIPAAELCEDQKIQSDLPKTGVLQEPSTEDYGLGFIYGDGSIISGRTEISYHSEDKLGCFINTVKALGMREGKHGNRAYVTLPYLNKEQLLNRMSPSFLAGWFDADGCYTRKLLRLSCRSDAALRHAQEFLDTLGIKSVVRRDGTSSYKPENEMYTLSVLSCSLKRFKALIPTLRLTLNDLEDWTPYREAEIRVTNVEMLDYQEDVYCCDVGVEEHSFMAEGVIISNCTEVVSEHDSDKCNLGTLWIQRFDTRESFAEGVQLATQFLLCGGLYSMVPTEKIKEVGLANNRIGLGLGGIYEWLIHRGSGYEVTPELHKWLRVYEQESDAAAYIGAKDLGVAKPKGVRAIAPTGSIGILAETTTGIEPLFCKAYKRRYLGPDQKWKYQFVVDGSVKRLLEAGIPSERIIDSYDINFKDRVKFQADVQNYVDMAISSTCNMPAWGTEDNNSETVTKHAKTLLKYAKRLRGFTIYPDGCRVGQPLTRVGLKEALSAEGRVFEESEQQCVGGVCGV